MISKHPAKIKAVQKKIMVRLSTEAAFTLFTEGFGKWWPLASHSVGGEMVENCVFEGKVNGRIYEVQKDGSQAEWGKVLAWQPFSKVVFHWYPGRTLETAQEVTVSFTEIPGGTLLDLVQTGWEILGDKAQSTREGYDFGWEIVLANYTLATAKA